MSDSFEQWVSIYDRDLENGLDQEKKELRTVCMLYTALEKELTRVRQEMGQQIKSLKADIKKRDFVQQCKSFNKLAETEQYELPVDFANKENYEGRSPLKTNNSNEFPNYDQHKSPIIKTTPTLFINPAAAPVIHNKNAIKIPKTPNFEDSNVMESSVIENTPPVVIHKKNKLSKIRINSTNQPSVTEEITSPSLVFYPPKKKKLKVNDRDSSVKSSIAAQEVKSLESVKETTVQKMVKAAGLSNDNEDEMRKLLNLFGFVVPKNEEHLKSRKKSTRKKLAKEATVEKVVEVAGPSSHHKKSEITESSQSQKTTNKRKSLIGHSENKRKKSSEELSTVYARLVDDCKSLNEPQKASTKTSLEPKPKRRMIDSEGPSMEIDEMIDLINDTDNESDTTNISEIVNEVLETSGDETDAGDATADNLQNDRNVFVNNYDRVPEKKTDDPKYAFKEVVRGKKRQKLKGWSCHECENYYKAANLSPEELEQKMNECSRHRAKYAPQETFPGFWDLSFRKTPQK